MKEIREYLKENAPLLFDGAMGTCFAALPGHAADRCEQACLSHPEEIFSIHQAYLKAGCRAIKTNTFSVGVDLAEGRDELAKQLITAGCHLALKAAQPYNAYVFADIGPAPEGATLSRTENYIRQAELFLAQGIQHFLVETLPSDEGIENLARYLKASAPNSFFIVSFAVAADGVTREGQNGQALFHRTAALPEVDAVGFNCISGPGHLLNLIQNISLGHTALSVMPNAGYPTVLGRRTVYQGTPDYFGQKLSEIVQAGAVIVGGCCGTTPAHMAKAAQNLAKLSRPLQRTKPRPAPPVQGAPQKNPFAEKLNRGDRVIAVELDPPVDDDITDFMAHVKLLRDAGIDAVTIADCPIGRPRADSSLLACKIKRELGVEPLPHMTCRDRNLNATKALLLGLSIEQVHNVLFVTGDPIPSQNRDEVKTVFNFNSRKLISYVNGLNQTLLQTPFHLFGALNLNARNFNVQLKLALEKEKNGVYGFLTQPVLSKNALENLKQAKETLHGKILGGIFPVVSYKNACFLNNEISGMHVCDEIISLYQGKNREEAEDIAVAVSVQIAQEIGPYTDGLYLMTPFKRVKLITRILHSLS